MPYITLTYYEICSVLFTLSLSLCIFSIMAYIFQVWFCRIFYFLFFLIPFDTGAKIKKKKKTAAGKVNFQRDIPKSVTQIAVYIISKRRIPTFLQ